MNIYFAPLEGITGYIYRNIHNELFSGVKKYYAPFVSPCHNPKMKGKEIRDLLPENNENINVIPQILSNNPEYFIKGAEQIYEMGYTEEININIGCPSGTVVSKNKGAGFLRKPDLMQKFFDEIFSWRDKKFSDLKISVKTRIGMYEPEEFEQVLDLYNNYPISELIIHPRTRAQLYSGVPNIDMFIYALNNSKNPVVYNGDINNVRDCEELLSNIKEKSGKDIHTIMIGRGLIGNPNLAMEINGAGFIDADQIKKYHDRLYYAYKEVMSGDRHLLFKMKELWTYLSTVYEDEKKVAKLVRKAQNLSQYNSAINLIFSSYLLAKK